MTVGGSTARSTSSRLLPNHGCHKEGKSRRLGGWVIVDCFLIVFFGSPVLMPKTGLLSIISNIGLSGVVGALFCVIAVLCCCYAF